MRKICVINQKGGVGKTTTSISLAAGLARQGKKVLIIDLDPQGNISTSLSEPSQKDMYDFLLENAQFPECVTKLGKNLDVMLAKENLVKAQIMFSNMPEKEAVLKRKLNSVKGYDFIIADCPPGLNLLNQNALLWADEAIIPVSCDYLGYDGLVKMVLAIQKMNEYFMHTLRVSKIVPTLYDKRNKISTEMLQKMHNEFYGMVSDPIRTCSKIKEAPKHKRSIFSYAKSSRGAKDYMRLVNELLNEEHKYAQSESQEKSTLKVEA